jgi:integrase
MWHPRHLFDRFALFYFTEFLAVRAPQRQDAFGGSTELQQLGECLPSVLVHSRAASTTKVYRLAYLKWKVWTDRFPHVKCIPASPDHVALYLIFLGQTAASVSVLKLACSSLAWAHSLAELPSPTHSMLVTETLAGLIFQLARPKAPKEPFSLQHLHSLMVQVDRACFTDMRNVTLMVLAFFVFFRFQEVVLLRVSNLTFFDSHLEILVEKSKTDQLRLGNVVVISRMSTFCPVAFLSDYMVLAGITVGGLNLLFRRVVFSAFGKYLATKDVPLTYSNVRDLVKTKAVFLGLDPSLFGTHSLRAGGSTVAANSGISDRLFQRHGHWATASAKDGYVKDSLDARLSVTKRMV